MIKLYKDDNKGNKLYAEYWIDNNKMIIHTGKVGKEGNTEEFNVSEKFNSENNAIKYFKERFEPEGYKEIPDNDICFLVVQFPMKSLKGNNRDHWLKEKVTEYLNSELGWRGIGHVDGFDMGEQINFPKKYALNIFCDVVDEEKGIAAIKRCLREYRLDYTQIKIASKPYLSDGEFELKYSAKKKDQTFSI
ncbi:hypothetical protein AAG747_11815 [Rapidithrix thailandica]|uniref:WGR domain-containing protein n=1 Tax=Rapidithrix thailandica TaxID=413964 RepID=A0AAW9S519_9BACT